MGWESALLERLAAGCLLGLDLLLTLPIGSRTTPKKRHFLAFLEQLLKG
jgi:hypothetical protein